MKANRLLKHNIDAMLSARQQHRKDLAMWCRRSESWLSQIFTDDDRNVPLKYLDRIADFFGIAMYQLFQPGISSLTERRSGRDRRTGRDRRISMAQHAPLHTPDLETVTPWERAILTKLRAITERRDREQLEHWIELASSRSTVVPNTGARGGAWETTSPPVATTQRTHGRRKVASE